MNVRSIGVLGLLGCWLVGCQDANPTADARTGQLAGRLVVTGSSTAAPLVAEIGKRFEALHPGVRIDVQTGGSSRGIRDAGTGLANIGMSSRNLRETEREGRSAFTLARDAVCFVVHASNSVPALSDEQLRGIYTGKIQRWNEVGGPDAPITVVSRAHGRSELDLVTAYFDLEPSDLQPDVIVGENQQGIKTVAGDPHAIIYISLGTAEYEVSLGRPIRLLPLGGVSASLAQVASGEFPLNRPLILITRPEADALTRAFVAFARSGAVEDLVLDHAFTPAEGEASMNQ